MGAAETLEPDGQADWMQARQFALLMDGWAGTQVPLLAVWVALGGLMGYFAPDARSVLWAGLLLVVTALGWRGWWVYTRRVAQAPVARQLAHLRRHGLVWLAQALGWGLAPLFFIGAMPAQAEAVGWALTLGVGAVLVSWSAAHLRMAQGFVVVLVLTLLASLWLHFDAVPSGSRAHWWQALLLLVYAAILWRIAGGVHQRVADSIELSYRNARLIESLRAQTRVAHEAARFRTRFLAGAAHDLKQPVNALGIYAEWLSNEPALAEELGPKILQSTRAINSLFDSLFDWVKIDAGRFELVERVVDLRPMWSDLEVQFGAEARQKGLTLRVHRLDAQLRTDPVMLGRVLGNLLANAIRYTARGGVLLAARRRAGGLSLEVWDTGIGIVQAQQAPIFEEFYKVPTTGTEEGFGLGLAIVQGLAQHLGFQVSVRSRPGRGTVFRVWVPPAALVLRDSAAHACGQSAGSGSGS